MTACSWEVSHKAGRHRGFCFGRAVCSDRVGLGAVSWVTKGGTRGGRAQRTSTKGVTEDGLLGSTTARRRKLLSMRPLIN